MSRETDNVALVRDFFRGWEGGTKRHLRDAYERYLAPDCRYSNSGLPTFSKAEAMAFFFADVASEAGIVKLVADIHAIAAEGNLVFTERTDHHYDKDGNDILAPVICGVFEIRDGRIVRWADYFDPRAMLALFETDASRPRRPAQ